MIEMNPEQTSPTQADTAPVALITGAARRIGRQIATDLVASGWRVVLHTRQSPLDDTLASLNLDQEQPVAAATRGDLGSMDDIRRIACEASKAFGRLDALINNASEFYPTPVDEATEADWDRLFASNAQGPFWLSQACLPALRQRGGSIINLIDIHAERPLKSHTLYCMAKAALRMMTLSLAKELAPAIRVNGISPGAILWPGSGEGSDGLSETAKQEIVDRVPMGQAGSPQDIAGAVRYLLQAPYVTGQILAVDGGRSLSM
jgi:pteridine reductase